MDNHAVHETTAKKSKTRRSVTTLILLCRLGMIATCGMVLWAIVHQAHVMIVGDAAAVREVYGPDVMGPIELWRAVLSIAALALYFFPMFVAFWFTHRFFREFELGNNFGQAPERLLRHVGWSMIVFWLATWFAQGVTLLLLTDRSGWARAEQLIPPLNEYFLAVALGLIMLCIASILAEARRINEENEQIV